MPNIFVDGWVDQFTRMVSRSINMRLNLTTAHHAAVVDDIGKALLRLIVGARQPARIAVGADCTATGSTPIRAAFFDCQYNTRSRRKAKHRRSRLVLKKASFGISSIPEDASGI